ncbi:hypothetical protein [Chryseobacterium sp. YR221]
MVIRLGIRMTWWNLLRINISERYFIKRVNGYQNIIISVSLLFIHRFGQRLYTYSPVCQFNTVSRHGHRTASLDDKLYIIGGCIMNIKNSAVCNLCGDR